MKLVIIGPGSMCIPPKGWGAVESLIWDISEHLKKQFHVDVLIVNTPNKELIISQTNSFEPDVVHLQYDDHVDVMPRIKCSKKFVTSHFGYLEHVTFYDHAAYNRIFQAFAHGANAKDFVICALSEGIKKTYIQKGCVEEKQVVVAPNGADETKFRFYDVPKYADRSIYLAKIEARKRQHIYQDIDSLYFAGNCINPHQFNCQNARYLGEWNKDFLYDELSNYANLVLLSNGEAHPLVCCEALLCGLGLVLSRVAAANLDLCLPFITIIPDDKLEDVAYVKEQIIQNRAQSLKYRKDIRQYGLEHFSWKVRVTHLFKLYCTHK